MLARQRPAWPPGERQAYHAITLGFYESEILRRVDPTHRTLGQFFQEEIATPLSLDAYIRLPEEIPNSRLAILARPGTGAMLLGMPWRIALASLNPRSNIRRALMGSELVVDTDRTYARNLEIPSGGAVGTARCIAHAYSVFATGGYELALRAETLAALRAPATPSKHGFFDECMQGDVEFSLGFMKPNRAWPFGSFAAFGAPGAGGAFGFADPQRGIGYAYVTNRMGVKVTGDPREIALRDAVASVVDR